MRLLAALLAGGGRRRKPRSDRSAPVIALLHLIGLRPDGKEVLHRKTPRFTAAVKARNDGGASAAVGKQPPCSLGTADRGRESDAARPAAGKPAEPFNEAEGLHSAVAAQKRVQLIDHDEAQVGKKRARLGVLSQQQRLKRLGRDLKNPRGIFQQAALLRRRGVAMPAGDRNARLAAKGRNPLELIVDQGLERRNVKRPDACGRAFAQKRQNGKEGRLGLARGRRGADENVVVGLKKRLCRGVLNRTQRRPAAAVDVVLDKGRVARKGVHQSLPRRP